MSYEIINSDCIKAMQEMTDGCIDAIVTDPPYGLSFMGANWDHNVPSVAYWSECLRVAKPGAHLLCFGGTRMFHRLMCAIEDAGWEIRDCIMWVYGSGFPKSMDVGKAIDKALGAERDKVPNPKSGQQTRHNTGDLLSRAGDGRFISPTPATDQAKKWDGWGTCLKPAWEPIIVARKPLDGTVAHNVMTYGTGAINIDACRVPTDEVVSNHSRSAEAAVSKGKYGDSSEQETHQTNGQKMGRFPANLVHDGSQEVLELFPNTGKSSGGGMHAKGVGANSQTNAYGSYTGGTATESVGFGDDGSAARFFYCAKANKKDRGDGNDHPTVKPNALMRWLVRLVCPQGGIVLDPFMGSGSTGVACMQEGMEFVGIDKDKHYCDVADQRMRRELDGGIQRSMF